jgi:hypothetical protein
MQSNANAGVQRDWDFCTAMKAKICRKDSLRGPVEFQTRRGLQSGSKLTRSKDGSEMEFSGALPPPCLSSCCVVGMWNGCKRGDGRESRFD